MRVTATLDEMHCSQLFLSANDFHVFFFKVKLLRGGGRTQLETALGNLFPEHFEHELAIMQSQKEADNLTQNSPRSSNVNFTVTHNRLLFYSKCSKN